MSRTFTVDDLNVVVGNYRQQQTTAAEQLRSLDDARAQTLKTLDLLHGAIIALETLRDSAPADVPAEPPAAAADNNDGC